MGGPRRRWNDEVPRGSVVAHPAVRTLLSRGDPGTQPRRHLIEGTELVAYSSTRVNMKRDAWELLAPTGILVQWIRPKGETPWAIALTHGELLDVFGEITESESWEEARCYHFPNVPPAAESFRVVGMGGATAPTRAGTATPRRAGKARTSRHFALLANAATYDVEAAAGALTEGTWLMPAGDPVPGDTLLFWRTRGRDGKRGVVALGRVTHAPELFDGNHAADRFWIASAPRGPQRRIRFAFLEAPGLPLWLDEDASGVLSQLTVSRAQGNKLYKVPEALWAKVLVMAEASTAPTGLPATTATWQEGGPRQPRVGDEVVDATFHVDTSKDAVSVVLESRGGTGDQARNVEYSRGLSLLLRRLADAGATLDDAYVDSSRVASDPIAGRRLDVGETYPIRLTAVPHLEALRTALGASMARVGREPGARGGGNRTKRLRMVITVGLSPSQLADALTGATAVWPAPAVPPVAAEPPPQPLVRIPVEEVAERVLEHLRTYGSLTEAEVTRMAGGPRAYRKLRRHLHQAGAPLQMEATPRGTLWRLGREIS